MHERPYYTQDANCVPRDGVGAVQVGDVSQQQLVACERLEDRTAVEAEDLGDDIFRLDSGRVAFRLGDEEGEADPLSGRGPATDLDDAVEHRRHGRLGQE